MQLSLPQELSLHQDNETERNTDLKIQTIHGAILKMIEMDLKDLTIIGDRAFWERVFYEKLKMLSDIFRHTAGNGSTRDQAKASFGAVKDGLLLHNQLPLFLSIHGLHQVYS